MLSGGAAKEAAELTVEVNVLGPAWRIAIENRKPVSDEHGAKGRAATWTGGTFGVHGNDPVYILSALSGRIHKFLAEYALGNCEACEEK